MSGIQAQAINSISSEADVLCASGLPMRWRNLERFVILETGFGAGRNFLATWQSWRDDPARCGTLHYIALESDPASAGDLADQHAACSQWSVLSAQLRAAWPLLTPGFHRLMLDQGRVVLTLAIGPIAQCLPQIEAAIDAFCLNQFALAANARILGRLARLALAGASLVGCAPAPELRRVFAQVGFVPQAGLPAGQESATALFSARFEPRWKSVPGPMRKPERRVVIIGAGLAGAAASERFAARGWEVALVESQAQAAQRASGNLAGIFMPLLSRDDNRGSRLARTASLFALHYWQTLGGIGVAFPGARCGVLQLARDRDHAEVQRALAAQSDWPAAFAEWLEPEAASARLGTRVAAGGWLFPQGGWAEPGAVCRAMLVASAPRLTAHFGRGAAQLRRAGDDWQVIDAGGTVIASAPVVILANGSDALRLAQASDLPLTAIRGQVTHVAPAHLPSLPHVVCGDGYLAPSAHALYCVGASYDVCDDAELRRDSHDANLARLQALLPEVSLDAAHIPLAGRVGFRCVAPDRLPLIGALPDASVSAQRCESVRDMPRHAGLYGLLGYASRGLIWAPLAAELLAAQIEGEPLPVERDLVDALDPARFAFKHRA